LSPACAERTPWLTEMLDKMADGLFDILEIKIANISNDFKGKLKTYLRSKLDED
jgi:hypothetical protein